MVRVSDLPAWFDREIAAEKQRLTPDTKHGRPRQVTVEAFLVGWFTFKMMGRSSLPRKVAEDGAQESLGSPGRRRKRGLAAQIFYVAISLAITIMRKIASFLERAKPDKEGRR